MTQASLTRREREVLEIVHRLSRASAAEVRAAMDDPPTDAAVRSVLRILVGKGHVDHESEGPRYVYFPTVPSHRAGRTALDTLLHTFFDGSTEGVMTALLEVRGRLTPAEKRRLKKMIDRAAVEGR